MKETLQAMARPFLTLGVTFSMLLPGAASGLQAEVQGGRKVFKSSVIPLPEQPGPVAARNLMVSAAKPEQKDEKLEIVLSLPIPAASRKDLESRVAKGEVIPAKELQTKYAGSQADVDKLTTWLKDQGFEITKVSPDRTSVYAKATVSQIEKSMQTQFVRVTRDGLSYNAARIAPSLPEDIGATVDRMAGFQPFREFRKHGIRPRPAKGRLSKYKQGTHEKRPTTAQVPTASPSIANAPPYTPSEILKAYDADGLGLTGAGQKIAIMIDTFPDDNDLALFWQQAGLAANPPAIEKINVDGGTLPSPSGEETLDAEWANGIAPGATVRIYATGGLAFVALDKALDQILADTATEPNMRQLSVSLGLGETFLQNPDGTPSDEVGIEHDKFMRLAAIGVNIFVSTGDAGSRPDNTGHNFGGPLQAEFPSTDPFVIAVGGTILSLNAVSGNVTDEEGWQGSGGGRSIFFPRSVFQVGPGLPSGSDRLVPDISATASPENGALIVFQGNPSKIGGTSWSAPVCAGLCALMNEARTKAGQPALPFLSPLIYQQFNNGGTGFRDITSGSNGDFNCNSGYDLVTGIGVPSVQNLLTTLSPASSAVRPAKVPAVRSNTTAPVK